MKSISHLFPSKDLEQIAWLNIIHYFSFEDTISVIVFKSNDKVIPIITVSSNENNYDESTIYLFGLRNYFMNRPDIKIITGTISLYEYELFKKDKVKCQYKFSDGIELTIDDIPEVYKLLQ
jgi:hypothetical protein